MAFDLKNYVAEMEWETLKQSNDNVVLGTDGEEVEVVEVGKALDRAKWEESEGYKTKGR